MVTHILEQEKDSGQRSYEKLIKAGEFKISFSSTTFKNSNTENIRL